ncbi:helix-turn-helix domain-containing protein [Pseudonocardiaceae bacterium YIM PH 21723]|nr:helix-turn-helix domain-containing protein [Pseudonocardiaceae bacterium YIM PH 21723]
MHTVAVLALDGVIASDVATPVDAFGQVTLADGSPGYRVIVCAPEPTVSAGCFSLSDLQPLSLLQDADTVVVAGCLDPVAEPDPRALDALRAAADRGTRLVSICVGAFVLAAAGILDGRRATTHWLAADLLAQRYPAVRVDPRPLFIDEVSVLTSAGAAAGLDLCLYLIGQDHGAVVAADAARRAVVPLQREGDQAQFIKQSPVVDSQAPFAATLIWLRDNHRRPLSLSDIARQAGVSVRTLNRRFAEQVGDTPINHLRSLRIRTAKELLEGSDLPVERIAREVGFESPTSFREAFRELVGVPPVSYRRTFRPARAV